MSLTDSCIQLLYTEELINEETQRKIERCGGSLSDSLRELMITVSEDHSKLRSLGDILLKLEETKSVAQEMINDYGKNKSIGKIIVTIFFPGEFLQPSRVTSCTVSQIASRTLSSVSDPDYDLVNASFPVALSPPTGIMLNSGDMVDITILFIDIDISAIGSLSVIPTASGRQQ